MARNTPSDISQSSGPPEQSGGFFCVRINIHMNRRAERIWAKIVVMFENLERYKECHPEPRTRQQQDIIDMFERQIVNETKKLKELGD